jgi:hypothetical protein
MLDRDALEALHADLAAYATDVQIRSRAPLPLPTSDPATALAAAFERLASGQSRGLQIRDRHEGTTWCDTLMPSPEGVRLTRIDQGVL